MNNKINKNILNNLVSKTYKLVKLIYFLLIFIIVLSGIVILKELNILNILLNILCVLSPIFIGFIIAWLFNPLVKKINSKGINKVLSIIIVYLLIFISLFIFIRIFIPVLYNELNDLLILFPKLIDKTNHVLDNLIIKFSKKGIDISSIKNYLNISLYSNLKSFTNNLPKNVINIVLNLFSTIGTILMGLVVGIYMLIDFERIKEYFLKLIPKKYRSNTKNLLESIDNEVRKTVNGTFLVALMVLVGDTILFSLIGLKSPLLFGLLCGITDLIPYIGPYIGGAAAVLVGFGQSKTIGFLTLICAFIIQLIENNILQPIVMSKATKLHPITIMIGLLIFGHFFGIIGLLLSTPILALLKVILSYLKIRTSAS